MRRIRVPGAVLNCATLGAGEPLLLLHGWPQTSHAWRFVAPLLSEHFLVVVPDLPGFGASARMRDGYDKKNVARLLHLLMTELGHDVYHVAGHDVGGQVAYPLAAQFPESVASVTFVEAGIPGLGASEDAANPLRGGSWHFGFNMVPDLPELLLAGRERGYLEFLFLRDSIGLYVTDAIDATALDVYARSLAAPGAVRASMGHYRALPTDIADNRALSVAAPLTQRVAVVGAAHGIGLSWLDSVQQATATEVISRLVDDSGHYLPEEQPGALSEILTEVVRGTALP
ncbi:MULTISPECIES: alpha/beta fold hydrolase [Streptomyces]|uniref:Alpha/beta hydrolase n=1 Tax=Streptomyces mordarskii TaxID=1226758 RepID=A0ABP3MQW1_9ACTN|nr:MULTISPECIES: alpha/beta hydrolase [Streptomyces]QTI90243.1 alpha/beta hydrolase [Streptomyces sp. AgN23]RSS45546.1 alpha/beta hydrolase [Streptomyces sp. WAC05858]WJD96350.1 alpha/beta hydrolase [Streptomyces antimycoticus]WTA86362.1 alpha/beta hydrolase [Streptomyces antimycoticus]WTB03080.1 alpha/beta hydrolase [Streptomyces antimycoticus]